MAGANDEKYEISIIDRTHNGLVAANIFTGGELLT